MKIGLLKSLQSKETKAWYRVSVSAFYFVQGLVFASWASRIPDIKMELGMNEAQLGGVLFFIPIGQMSAMAFSGWFVNKLGSRKMLIIGALLYPLALVLLGLVGSILQLSAALIFFGMTANLCNIAVNTQAVGVERIYGQSIMGSFHGLWSLAGFIGGIVSALMVGLNIGPLSHFIIIYLVALGVVLTMKNTILPRDSKRNKVKKEGKHKTFVKPDRLIIMLGLVSFAGMVCEGTMFDWSSVYFEQVIQPSKNLIRLGYIAAMCSMAGGRFAADKLITRFGVVNVLKCSGITIAFGLLLSVLFPYLLPATIGFLFVGLGISSIVPICYSLAGRSQVMSPSVAIAAVSSIGFLGFLLGPPVIGFVAQALDLRWSLGFVAIIGLLITLLAPQINKSLK